MLFTTGVLKNQGCIFIGLASCSLVLTGQYAYLVPPGAALLFLLTHPPLSFLCNDQLYTLESTTQDGGIFCANALLHNKQSLIVQWRQPTILFCSSFFFFFPGRSGVWEEHIWEVLHHVYSIGFLGLDTVGGEARIWHLGGLLCCP